MRLWAVASLLVLAGLAGCASSDKPPPTPLEELEPKIAGRQVWASNLSRLGFPLVPAVSGSVFHVAFTQDSPPAPGKRASASTRWLPP